MAMTPRDIPITRGDVQGWVNAWKKTTKANRKPLRDYIKAKVDALNLPDPYVSTVGHDSYGDSMLISDFIVEDLESYGVSTSSLA